VDGDGLSRHPAAGAGQALAHPTYRPDIDGLRALAVLSVLGYHAFPTLVRGGYIGVDVFFVISGYLICGIVFAGAAAGKFSFTDFYVRRVNRIFPALALVLASCLLVGWVYLLPDEYGQLRRHANSGALFVANYTLNHEAGYWDTVSELKPLLHLWSLAVEEQFYFLFPVTAIVLVRYRTNILASLIALAIVSFMWNLARVTTNGADAFYLPQTRFWELLLGGMLAHSRLFGISAASRRAAVSPPDSRWETHAANLASFLGFAAIFSGVALMNRNLGFPGYWALVPTTGTLLVIGAGRKAWCNRVVFAHPVAVWFGLISYPLYLWHWPVLAFIRIVRSSEAEPSAVVKAFALALSVLLAWLTYRFVEKPIRNHPRRRRMAAVLCPAILLLAAIAGIDGVIPARSFSPDIAKLVGEMSDASGPWAEMRGQSSIPGGARTAIFIGDSHADQYKARIARLIADEPERTRSAIFFDKGSCLPIPHVKRVSDRVCEDEVDIKEARAALAANENIDTVVLAASWRGQLKFHDLRFDAEGVSELMNHPGVVEKAFLSLEAMIESFRRQGRRVFVVLDNPADTDDARVNPRSLIVRRLSGTFFLRSLSDSTLTKRDVLASQEPTRTRLILAAHRTGALVIDPMEFLCGASTCPIVIEDGRPIYFDSNHLRRDFVRDHVHYFDDIMKLEPSRLGDRLPSEESPDEH
jgi:peptidoglycan/LPS O-acetylase OafA/YrhL